MDANTHFTLAWFGSLPLANPEDLVSGTLSLVPRRAHVRMLLLSDPRDDFAAQQLERFPVIGPLSRLGNVEHVMVEPNLGERPHLIDDDVWSADDSAWRECLGEMLLRVASSSSMRLAAAESGARNRSRTWYVREPDYPLLSVVPARLEYACGHAGLVSLPLVKGETAGRQRSERVDGEKAAARLRSCDFCAPALSPAIAVEVVTVPQSGPGSSPAVTLDQGHTGTMVNNADGHPPMGQQGSMSALPAARLTTNQGSSSGKIEPILEPAAQQPTRTRSSRAMHRLNADPEQEAAQAGAIRRERSTRRRLSPEQHKRARHVSGDRRALDIADRHHGAACCPPLVLIMLLWSPRPCG